IRRRVAAYSRHRRRHRHAGGDTDRHLHHPAAVRAGRAADRTPRPRPWPHAGSRAGRGIVMIARLTTFAEPTAVKKPSRCVAFVMALVASGCLVGPNYKRPPTTQPDVFRGGDETQTSAESIADEKWWEIFDDDALQTLIRT